MKLFNLEKQTITEVEQSPFKSERELQNLIESNMEGVFNLKLIKSEFTVDQHRIDSLCFDEENKSFVIVEYKKGGSYSLVDQGFTYLGILLDRKADFLLELNEYTKQSWKKNEIDWEQSKLIFISSSFNSFQKKSVNFKDMPFELWEVKRYANGSIIFNQHESTSKASITTPNKRDSQSVISKVTQQVKVYSEETHIESCSDEIKEVYSRLKERILGLGEDVEMSVRKTYIGFKRRSVFADIIFQKKQLKLAINMKKGTLSDPMKISRDIEGKGHFGSGDYEIAVDGNSDLDYLMFLIGQSYSSKS